MTRTKYRVLAATITAAGWGFFLVSPTSLSIAASDTHAEQHIINEQHSSNQHSGGHDHADSEPKEMKETFIETLWGVSVIKNEINMSFLAFAHEYVRALFETPFEPITT